MFCEDSVLFTSQIGIKSFPIASSLLSSTWISIWLYLLSILELINPPAWKWLFFFNEKKPKWYPPLPRILLTTSRSFQAKNFRWKEGRGIPLCGKFCENKYIFKIEIGVQLHHYQSITCLTTDCNTDVHAKKYKWKLPDFLSILFFWFC